jgi:hypothetical protein
MKKEFLSDNLINFVNTLGNLMLPGSILLKVPGWSAQPPSSDFFANIGKFQKEIESFRHFLKVKYGSKLTELTDEQMKDCILENANETKNFFQALGEFYIQDYYSRPKTLMALGLNSDAPFPIGNSILPGDLEMLDTVFKNGKKYR